MEQKLTRRSALKGLGFGAAAVASAGALFSTPFLIDDVEAATRTNAAGITDVDILNFALNLEYLEAEFYAYTTGGNGIPVELTNGVGKEGLTTGGSATDFNSDSVLQAVALNIADDELDHVKYLRRALGRRAIGKPAIKLDPLGSTASAAAFLTYSRAFEDTGVSAYGGAAKLITSKEVLGAAARILATEAYHAGSIRLQVVQKGLSVSALDGKDVPPTLTTFFAVYSKALAIVRNVKEVLKIVEPFFPNGLNGKIR